MNRMAPEPIDPDDLPDYDADEEVEEPDFDAYAAELVAAAEAFGATS